MGTIFSTKGFVRHLAAQFNTKRRRPARRDSELQAKSGMCDDSSNVQSSRQKNLYIYMRCGICVNLQHELCNGAKPTSHAQRMESFCNILNYFVPSAFIAFRSVAAKIYAASIGERLSSSLAWRNLSHAGSLELSSSSKSSIKVDDGGLCVCHPLYQRVQCHCSSLQPLNEAGGQRMTSRRWPTKLVMSWDAVRDV